MRHADGRALRSTFTGAPLAGDATGTPLAATAEHAGSGAPADAHSPASAPAGAPTLAAPRNRAEALRQLQMVADFFRRTEPHSPVAYLADKAIKWGEMPLHRWLGEVVKDPASMAHLQELLGLAAPADPSSDTSA